MVTKTQRILDLLPGTFAAQPAHSPLQKLIETYGAELQGAENTLAAILRAHWCTQADLGRDLFDDLPRIAALYGLAPQEGDDVEEFRRRLKLWVSLILEGPATVRGLLRATSILTGLEIDDSDAAFDPWWTRAGGGLLTTKVASRRDAGPAIFGFDRAFAQGSDATSAQITGQTPLSDPLTLTASTLHLTIDGGAPAAVALAGVTTPEELIATINTAMGQQIATLTQGRLKLSSPSTGPASSIALNDATDDAAPELLGLAPRAYTGRDATGAALTGLIDLSAGADLSTNRYIRLLVDGTHLAEIDCAGASAEATSLDEIAAAINTGLGLSVASHDGTYLSLTSPTIGATSGITFQTAAAQDARLALFGPIDTVASGRDAQPAQITGTPDLSAGVDLSAASRLLLSIETKEDVEIECTGSDPANTQLPEIIGAINSALRADVATTNGRNLILKSIEAGPTGSLRIGHLPEGDAAKILLGLEDRIATGSAATRATLQGALDLSAGIDIAAQPLLQLAQDGRTPQTFDLSDAAAAPLDAEGLAQAINSQPQAPQASVTDNRLTLMSHLEGNAGQLELIPISTTLKRNFVSRVPIAEDAAKSVLGTLSAVSQSAPAAAATLQGNANLSRGVDLRAGGFLRVQLDDAPAVDINCAGPRPRHTTLDEVLEAINSALGAGTARSSGSSLELVSPNLGAASQITLLPPQATDAQPALLATGPQNATGSAARQVAFVGTNDLSGGIDLTAAAHLKLAIDGNPPEDIDCRGFDPANTTLGQIVVAINLKLGAGIASHDGRHLLLTSPTKGADSRLDILLPSEPDATAAILGVSPGRSYTGQAAQPAQIAGLAELSAPIDLSTARFLRLGFDATPPQDIDCASAAADATQTTGAEIAAAINAALGAPVAQISADHLLLTSPSLGASSRLSVETATGGDATQALLGEAPRSATGTPAQAGQITGSIDLRQGVDLSERSVLRLALKDALPLDIDLAGEAPAATAPEEITEAINRVLPDTASLSADGQLLLTAPAGSTLSLQPLRHFELIDYPQQPVTQTGAALHHGDALFAENTGPSDAPGTVRFTAPQGTDSPGLVDIDTGRTLRIRGAILPGDTAEITEGADGLNVSTKLSPTPRVYGLPLLPHLEVPQDSTRFMAPGLSGRRGILISDSFGSDVIELTEITRRDVAPALQISAAHSLPDQLPEGVFVGQLQRSGTSLLLTNGDKELEVQIEGNATQFLGRPVAIFAKRLGDSLLPRRIRVLYDLQITAIPPATPQVFNGVVLDQGPEFGALSLPRRINETTQDTPIVFASAVDQTAALSLSPGTNRRVFVECLTARYDAADFDESHFAGGDCLEIGVFDACRFAENPRAKSTSVFAPADGGTATDVTLSWAQHTPGRAQINLPLDMPARFGARFDQDRFALADDAPEIISGLVTEPATDPQLFTTQLAPEGSASALVTARAADVIPIGFDATDIPFARPVALSGGTETQAARTFLNDPGLPGFIEISAIAPGLFANRISIAVCDTAPGIYDLIVTFDGARFENARARVNGPELTGTVEDFNRPGPRGVQHLKAAGIDLTVTRDGTPPEDIDC
ncbi:hypothetical protein J7399_18160 [Shimia sp. R9_1]|uniref:hypothetical protein n=1 Tax=Shimia sp. R9_1 TaxID=2821111 RepID=UPI001ADC1DF6|nr:hypothetical protein [Shimia sp. R9_1]MBO9409367.1 hypothetical protein [Shimia sp. R9_1]